MYEQKFNFSQRPFSVCPQPEEYFPGQSHQQAIAASRSCVERRNGPATIIGAVGTGKSLTLQVIGEVFAEQFDVVSIECSRLEQRSELLQSILFGMNLPFRDMGEGELRLSLIDHLKNGNGNSNGILLLVDEADRLSIELLDELRLITNVVRDGLSQAQLVLAGTQRLEESLNDPRLASFGQRIASRSYLQNFSREEVGDYIAGNIERAGGNADEVFEEEAIDEVARSSDGCPRVINQLCERSLAVAAVEDQAKVTQDIVQIAWAELQNLPMPSRNTCSVDTNVDCTSNDSTDSVLEFGSLDDDQDSGFTSNYDYGDQADDAVAEQGEQEPEASVPQPEQDDSLEEPRFDSQATEVEEEREADEEQVVTEDEAEVVAEAEDVGEAEVTVDGEDQSDVPGAWSGQLPTNLGVAGYGAFGAGAAGFAAATFGSGDPFAPEEESPPTQQFQYGSQSAFETPSVSDYSPSQFESQGFDNVDSESVNDGSVDANVDNPDQSFQQEQQDSREEVGAQTSPVEAPVGFDEGVDNGFADEDSENDVRAAFDGLDQIDQARSSEGVPTLERQPVEPAVDPFAEDFEDEVLLQDAYSPFVAQQNKSSLSVTSEHLSHLQPNDEVDAAEETNSFTPVENEAVASEFPPGFEMPPAASPTSYIPVQSVSTELRFPEPPQSIEAPQSLEPQESVEEIDPDLAALTSDFSFDEETPSPAPVGGAYPGGTDPVDGAQFEDGVQGQAVDMGQDIYNAIDSDPSPITADPFFQQTANASEQSLAYGTHDVPEAMPADEPQAIQYSQQPPLDESQQVLREILAQQKIVNDTQFHQPQASEADVDSISVEYPITDYDNYQTPSGSGNDDRDMLRVNESHYSQTPQREPEQPNPYADAEPSTGEAQRMDYGQLFDQLRNMPKK